MKYKAAIPASSTHPSRDAEIRCNFPNSASSGLFAAVAWIDPICTRSAAIFGLTACCETTVSRIINTTHNAAGVAKLANVRVLTKRASKSTIPQTTPIMCIHQSPYPTIAPAWSRLANIRNAPGATTKLRNASLPSHKLKPRNSIVRRRFDMRALYKTAHFWATALLSSSLAWNESKVRFSLLLNSKFSTKAEPGMPVAHRCGRIGKQWWATKDLNL
jgi:hypothetical protein